MKTLSLVCGSRYTVFDFYKEMRNFKVHFLSGNTHPIDQSQLHFPNNVHLTNFKLSNPYKVDPIEILFNKTNNLSWKYFDKLERFIQSSHIVGLYDTYYFWNNQTIDVAKKRDIPIFIELWCTIPNHVTSKIPPYSWITKKVVNDASLVILRNKTAYSYAKSLGIPDSKMTVSYMGINLNHFTPAPKISNNLTILYVGTLTKEKGIFHLLNSFEKLTQKYSNICLSIAGTGPLQNVVQEAAQKLPITYHGFVPYERLPLLYQHADIFCAPSYTQKFLSIPIWQEYFSYALMEAQAAGLPIVATQSGGIPEEVDNNMLVPENDPVALQKGLSELIINESLRKELGLFNRRRAEKLFDLKTQAAQTETLIQRIV